MPRYYKIVTLFIFILLSVNSFSQSDTTRIEKKSAGSTYKRARIATVMSAILPGAGQVYNKKYWKLPIIYAGLGGFGYLVAVNQERYNYYSAQLRAENDNDPSTVNQSGYSSSNLQIIKNDYRKNRDLGIIGCAVFYVLNILDANVDAHLKTFDVSDNLSIKVRPYHNVYLTDTNFGLQTGVAINLNFR